MRREHGCVKTRDVCGITGVHWTRAREHRDRAWHARRVEPIAGVPEAHRRYIGEIRASRSLEPGWLFDMHLVRPDSECRVRLRAQPERRETRTKLVMVRVLDIPGILLKTAGLLLGRQSRSCKPPAHDMCNKIGLLSKSPPRPGHPRRGLHNTDRPLDP